MREQAHQRKHVWFVLPNLCVHHSHEALLGVKRWSPLTAPMNYLYSMGALMSAITIHGVSVAVQQVSNIDPCIHSRLCLHYENRQETLDLNDLCHTAICTQFIFS